MNSVKISWHKCSPLKILSLGIMILGIGCLSWALFNLWMPSDYFVDAIGGSNTTPTSLDAELNKLSIDGVAKKEVDKILYSVYPAEGDNIGSLTIPALNRKLTIYEGTENKELKKGVGHFIKSVLPGENDNCVLSGHRDTVFRQLGNLKIGDLLIVETSAGKFTYEINGTRIVHADDKTVIVPLDHAVLTMTTCYPFNYIGPAPDRYIVSANLVKSE